MAESEAIKTETVKDHGPRLKYLEFVQVAAVHAIMILSKAYDFAKENSGPLKPGVQTVEGTVKTVIGPVYDKFHSVPLELLKFADRKLDGFAHKVKEHVPVIVKEASSQVSSAAQSVPQLTREVQLLGLVGSAKELASFTHTKVEPKAKEMYVQYETVAKRYAVSALESVNRLPLVPDVAHMLTPTAVHWSQKYNKGVRYMAEKGYSFSAYLPLLPIERIAKLHQT